MGNLIGDGDGTRGLLYYALDTPISIMFSCLQFSTFAVDLAQRSNLECFLQPWF